MCLKLVTEKFGAFPAFEYHVFYSRELEFRFAHGLDFGLQTGRSTTVQSFRIETMRRLRVVLFNIRSRIMLCVNAPYFISCYHINIDIKLLLKVLAPFCSALYFTSLQAANELMYISRYCLPSRIIPFQTIIRVDCLAATYSDSSFCSIWPPRCWTRLAPL